MTLAICKQQSAKQTILYDNYIMASLFIMLLYSLGFFTGSKPKPPDHRSMTMAAHVLILLAFILCLSAESSATNQQQVDSQDITHLAHLNSDFSIRFYTSIASNVYGNVFCSPLSISSAFAMLQLGSNGDTRKELDEVIGY